MASSCSVLEGEGAKRAPIIKLATRMTAMAVMTHASLRLDSLSKIVPAIIHRQSLNGHHCCQDSTLEATSHFQKRQRREIFSIISE